MHVNPFGRIENLSVRAGDPVFNSDVKVVRVARVVGESDPLRLTNAEEFELTSKSAIYSRNWNVFKTAR